VIYKLTKIKPHLKLIQGKILQECCLWVEWGRMCPEQCVLCQKYGPEQWPLMTGWHLNSSAQP